MDHQQKLDFVLKMTKHALQSVQHFDGGGTVLGGPVTAGTANAVNPGDQGFVGSVGNFLGTNNNFQATGANINPGTNTAQLNQAYSGAQGGLNNSNNLAGTLQPGVGQAVSNQDFLSNQLRNQSQGIGPNPAQAALNNNTGRNINQAAALAAGVRGAGSNAGLIASNAANQGAQTQQQAVGQQAQLQAEQQLAAQGQLQNLSAQQVGQGTNAVELQNQTNQNEQNILQGANTSANNANASLQQNINSTNASVAAGNQNANQNVLGGIGSAINSVGKIIGGFAKGGEVPSHLKMMADIYHPHMAGGGEALSPYIMSTPNISPISVSPAVNLPAYNGPKLSDSFNIGSGGGGGGGGSTGALPSIPSTDAAYKMPSFGASAPGGASAASAAPSLLSSAALLEAKGGRVMKSGGKVPGKPKVDHDSYDNDTVDAKLSPGEVVLDLETLKDKGKLGQMARFVAKEVERKKAGRKLI